LNKWFYNEAAKSHAAPLNGPIGVTKVPVEQVLNCHVRNKMNREKIRGSWQKYIDGLFEYSLSEPPFLFEGPCCATCAYWHLLGEDELEAISIFSPAEYKSLCEGIEGKIVKAYKEEGEIKDVYTDHLFHGFCKRYPPSLVDTNSTIRFRPIFSFINGKIPAILSTNAFPLMPHKQWCGEWKQAEWVKEILIEKAHTKQAD
jgi:hypothetical protein